MASQDDPTSDEPASVGKLEHGGTVADVDKQMAPTQTLANWATCDCANLLS